MLVHMSTILLARLIKNFILEAAKGKVTFTKDWFGLGVWNYVPCISAAGQIYCLEVLKYVFINTVHAC